MLSHPGADDCLYIVGLKKHHCAKEAGQFKSVLSVLGL